MARYHPDVSLWRGVLVRRRKRCESTYAGLLARIEADDTAHITEELDRTHRQGSRAAIGLDEVLAALVEGRVHRPLLDLESVQGLAVCPVEHPGLSLPEHLAGEGDLPADSRGR